jgi:hypothetical protein
MWRPKFTVAWTPREWAEFWLTSFIGFFTFVNAIAAAAYYYTYKQSAAGTSHQTEQLICAANIQAQAAQNMATAASTQAAKMTELAVQATQQANFTNQLAAQAKRQADATYTSLSIVQEQFRLEQRPLVRINLYDLREWPTGEKIKVPERDKPVQVNIHFLNVGKTNAINAIVHAHILFGSQGAQFRIEPADTPATIGEVLVPGTTDDEGILVTAVSVKDPYSRETAALDVGQLLNWDGTQISVFGRIAYEDGYGTKYCLPYMVNLLPQGGWVYVTKLSVTDSGSTRIYTTSQICPPNTRR